MALARFRTYEASPSEVVVRLPSGDGEGGTVAVRAVVDHRTHRAVGAYEVAEGGRTMRGLLAWDMAGMAVARPPRASTAVAPAAPARTAAQAVSRAAGLDAGQWARRGYRTAAPLDRSLRLVLAVAADRPDNARLLARSGPLWLRDERLDGHGYGVFAGPRPHPRSGGNAGPERPASDASGRSPLTYWIDADGNLRRIRARLAPGRETTVDFVAGRVKYGVPAAPWREAG
ncbi:hypothetical protein SGFS_061560 [Streptomyces graminofaciens]|uniref:MucB/RseB N-terminal domain-containing protein n=2 Tax=Streptomyces graminofaciens TaxID=68212 RepID=A0ABM7FFA8_9ACTN|nr:hypothetical protein SGFS_061560 [Streptomyces graminofaciens]